MNFLDPGTSADNLASAYRLTGQLDVGALTRSIDEIVRRHEILQMTFPSMGGKPTVSIQSSRQPNLKRVDLQSLPSSQREASARRLAVDEVTLPFDLAEGPLVRVCLWQLSGEDYVFLVVMHSIVSDGRSMEIFFQELSQIYPAFADGMHCPLPRLPQQYIDFSARQRRVHDGGNFKDQRSYWKKQLAHCPEALRLPTDHPRSPKRTDRGATHSTTVSRSLSAALQNFCGQKSVSPLALYLAAFKTLLYRYTEQEDIVVGVTVDGRHKPQFESLIGCFAQNLPLRTDLSGDPDFPEILSRVSQTISGGLSNQDLSFEQLLIDLQPERDLNRDPICQVSFQLHVAANSHAALPALKIEPLELGIGGTRYDLSLKLIQSAEAVDCRFQYSQNLFEAATIARMAEHFKMLLDSIASNPAQAISLLPMLTEAERLQLLGEQQDLKTKSTETAFLHELFEAQAERTPESTAVIGESETLTYCGLNHRANQLAHYLQELGVRPEVPVGICLERSVSLVVAVLAVLKAGGACLPLDPELPKERLALMATVAGSPVILTEQRFTEKLPIMAVRIVSMDTTRDILDRYQKDSPISGLTDGNLGQMFFTSGSTGEPKAVMWNQRKQSRHEQWSRKTFGLNEHDRYLMKTAISFTPLNLEVFWPLTTRARLIIAPTGIEQDGAALVRLIEQHQITILNSVPSMLRVLLEEPGIERCTSLREVICFGEALSPELETHFFSKLSAGLSVIYGATEAPSATFRRCRRENPCQSLNIGQRLRGRQIRILSSRRALVPMGVPGEICLGGEALARGYLHRPDLTAERFVPDPFGTPGARIYRTGDRARCLPDGNLEFLGRTDHQVKIRGYRIEPGEIEMTLERNPAVQQAVVVMQEDGRGGQRLVAYVVPRHETDPSARDLRSFAKEWLPNYMVPSAFVLLEKLPLTSNAKVDRKALPAPDWSRRESEVSYVPPGSPVEVSLVAIWEDILRKEQVGILDSFFELGGDSLLATRMMSRIRETYHVEVSLRLFFEAPFVQALATAIVDSLAAQMSSGEIEHLLS